MKIYSLFILLFSANALLAQSKISMKSAPASAKINECAGPFIIEFNGESGSPEVMSLINFELNVFGEEVSVFSDDKCREKARTFKVAIGEDSLVYYVRSKHLGYVTIENHSNNGLSLQHTLVIGVMGTMDSNAERSTAAIDTVYAARTEKKSLVLVMKSGPDVVAPNECSGPFILEYRELSGNPELFPEHESIAVRAKGVYFYASSTCSEKIKVLKKNEYYIKASRLGLTEIKHKSITGSELKHLVEVNDANSED